MIAAPLSADASIVEWVKKQFFEKPRCMVVKVAVADATAAEEEEEEEEEDEEDEEEEEEEESDSIGGYLDGAYDCICVFGCSWSASPIPNTGTPSVVTIGPGGAVEHRIRS